jgi:hypothetical protein
MYLKKVISQNPAAALQAILKVNVVLLKTVFVLKGMN